MIGKWLRLIRPINILLIVITPLCLWVVLVNTMLGTPQLRIDQVLNLGLAIGMVAAAGNVVNDIADRTIDQLNQRPNPLLEGLKVNHAWVLYFVLNAAALFLTCQLAYELNKWAYALLLPLAIIGLGLYSFVLKCTAIWGNLVVSLFTAGVPAMVYLAEPMIGEQLYKSASAQSLVAYIFIAFFGNFSRELVKDLQDVQGDRAAGCKTAAVLWPSESIVSLVYICLFMVLSAIAYLATIWYKLGVITGAISWAALWLLVAAIFVTIHNEMKENKDEVDWRTISRQLKLAMAFGLVLLILVGLNIWN